MTRPRSLIAPTILLVAAAAFYAGFIARTSFRVGGLPFFTLIDDAMISMRYAQHLAEGHGLVWNIGEAPVQGFTNPGWMLLMALLHAVRIPLNSISLVVMVLSAAILVGHAAVVHRLCIELLPTSKIAPLMSAAITAFYFPLVFWSLRGMELGFLVLLINLAALMALQSRSGAFWAGGLGLLLAIAVLVRLDAILQCIGILIYVLRFKRARPKAAWISVAIVVVTVIAILLCQRAYFGSLLPNTYYQKMTGGPLDERLQHGLLVFLQYALRDLVMMTLVVAFGLWRFRDLRSPETLLLASLFVVQCLYSIWVGGDYAEPEVASANRFIAQGVPALIALFCLVVERSLAHRRVGRFRTAPAWFVALATGFASLIMISGAPWYQWTKDNAPLLRSDVRRVRAGLAISAHTSPNAVVAVHAAGQIPYYSQRAAIDLLGLNDPVIARAARRISFYPGHDKWNYEYSIGELLPDLIADNWIRLPDYIAQLDNYRKLTNGMYVRTDTTLVDEAGLEEAFP